MTVWQRFRSNHYLRSIAVVMTGTVAAQAIPLLVMPLLTRMVSPEEMGVFSTWFGMAAILSVATTLRFEILLTIESDPTRQYYCFEVLRRLNLTLCVLVTLVTLVLVGGGWTPGWDFGSALALGLTVWAMAANKAWIGIAVSHGRFRELGWLRLSAAATAALLQLALVWVDGTFGLTWGYALGSLVGIFVAHQLLRDVVKPPRASATSTRPVLDYARRNLRTPAFALPADLISAVAAQLPILLAGHRHGAAAAGLLALSIRTLDAPLGIVSASVLDVYKKRAVSEFATHGNCRQAFIETARLLALVALIPTTVVLLAGPMLFRVVYGMEWEESGVIAQILAPMVFLRFFASPLGYTLYIAHKPHLQLYWQIALLVLTTIAFLVPQDFTTAVATYSVVYGLLYVVYLMMSLHAANGDPRNPRRPV